MPTTRRGAPLGAAGALPAFAPPAARQPQPPPARGPAIRFAELPGRAASAARAGRPLEAGSRPLAAAGR